MKKVFTLLMAVAFVVGITGIAAAECLNCKGNAGNIDRGCETGQSFSCAPFDFESTDPESNDYSPRDYCDDANWNRAVFKICDCITDGDFEDLAAGDTVDISMEILVNGETGDNGVYWAENVESIDLGVYASQTDACAAPLESSRTLQYCPDVDNELYTNVIDISSQGGIVRRCDTGFEGDFEYLTASGALGNPYGGPECSLLTDSQRVTKLQPDIVPGDTNHGYVINEYDEYFDNATWVINIPAMRVDPARTNAGDQVWVRICLLLDCESAICSSANECCCDIFIGTLCCPEDDLSSGSLIYPFFPPANTTVWNLLGMTITNLSPVQGTATITMYEEDGDVGTLEQIIPANGIFLTTIADLAAAMTGTGLGDSMSYVTVEGNFSASGFAMIADTVDGASMGYLPIRVELQSGGPGPAVTQ